MVIQNKALPNSHILYNFKQLVNIENWTLN